MATFPCRESGKWSLAECPGKKVNIGADGLQCKQHCGGGGGGEESQQSGAIPLSLGKLSQMSDTSLNRKMFMTEY